MLFDGFQHENINGMHFSADKLKLRPWLRLTPLSTRAQLSEPASAAAAVPDFRRCLPRVDSGRWLRPTLGGGSGRPAPSGGWGCVRGEGRRLGFVGGVSLRSSSGDWPCCVTVRDAGTAVPRRSGGLVFSRLCPTRPVIWTRSRNPWQCDVVAFTSHWFVEPLPNKCFDKG